MGLIILLDSVGGNGDKDREDIWDSLFGGLRILSDGKLAVLRWRRRYLILKMDPSRSLQVTVPAPS